MLTRRSLLLSAGGLPLFSISSRANVLQARDGDQTRELQRAIADADRRGGVVQLGPGRFETSVLTIKNDVSIIGVPGATHLHAPAGGKIFSIRQAKSVTIQGVSFSAVGEKGNILTAEGIPWLAIEDCSFAGGEAGMRVASCAGRIANNQFQFHEKIAIQSIDSKGFRITGNRISDIGNSGIQVWQTNAGEDGSLITENHISRIASKDGGNGQNGNGINVFKAGNVTVANNRISDCAFSGIRNNSGPNGVITGNSISRCNEVALFVEFSHEGSVVSDNMIETVAHGISIANSDVGGRLTQCTGNVIRNIKGVDPIGIPLGGGILADADIIIANNMIDKADLYGIRLGWGPYGRNMQAANNIMMECRRGIEFSAVAKGPYIISDNIISGATEGAIVGMDHDKVITSDFGKSTEAAPDFAQIAGNVIRS